MSFGGVKVRFVKSNALVETLESYTVRPAMSSSASEKMMTRHAEGAVVLAGRVQDNSGVYSGRTAWLDAFH